ncbi:MAG TPA: hypothetical protein VK774_09285, partial [Solirubrobacteraceae bacterium]|nr:hypothetical protein [Solirubrobacteraceae bacterium]
MSSQTNAPCRRRRRRPGLFVLASLFALTLLGSAGAGVSAAASPWWHVTSRLVPSHVQPEGEGTIVVQAINLGNAPTSGNYAFSDTLPPGFKLEEAHFFARPSSSLEEGLPPNSRPDFGPASEFAVFEYCKETASSISCSSESALFGAEPEFLLGAVIPYDFLEMTLTVKAEPGAASGAVNEAQISGGGASTVKGRRAIPVDSEAVPFGVEDFSLAPEEEGGTPDTHAGSHPYQLTNTLTFNRANDETLNPPAMPRTLNFKLPPGQVGNATALPQCSDQDFAHVVQGGETNLCPSNTAIGAAVVTASTFPRRAGEEEHFTVPVFNLTPATGEPARFGFEVLRNPVILDTAVRSGPG